MKVIVEKDGNRVCIIEVSNFDTVLAIKEKIEMCLGIPVSKQTLIFEGRFLLNDHLDVLQCNIVHDSSLQLFVSSNHNNDQVRHHQTQQSPAPSNLAQQIIPDHQNIIQDLIGQDFSTTTEDMIQMQSLWPQTTENISKVQDSSVMVRSNNNQMLQKTEQSPVTSASMEELIKIKEQRPWTTEETNKFLHLLETSEENLSSQDSPVTVTSNTDESLSLSALQKLIGIQDCHPALTVKSSRDNESSPPSNSGGELLGNQEMLPPVTAENRRNKNQMVRDRKSSPSGSIINIPDSPEKKKIKTSPMKLTVMVQPFMETRKIPVEVNANDNVEELKKELVKMKERGELDLPQEGYFFIYKQETLTEAKSFLWNCVAHGDTIEIFRGKVTYGATNMSEKKRN